MKNIFILCLLLGVCHLGAQNGVAKIDTGTIKGARYRILFPENWKGKLVMYAHGYEFMGASPRQSRNPGFINNMKPFLDRGFAVAASDYSMQGYALVEGIEDTEALRGYFVKTYGKPDSTFMVGHSMGGGITLGIMENFSQSYQGALPLCPLSSRTYLQVRKEFDLFVVVNALFPGIVPKMSEIFDLSKPAPALSFPELMPKAMAIRKAIVAKDSLLGLSIAKRFDLKFDDLAFTLMFGENVLRDVAQKAKGNPFDNTNTVYSGFPNDKEVNLKAERIPATAGADRLFVTYDRTGNVDKPIVLMHTLYDQLIPPSYGVTNYENMLQGRGKSQFLTVLYTNGQGHCQFTPQQTGIAFDALRAWVKTGKKAQARFLE